LLGTHPDDPDRRVLAMTKNNIAPLGPSLGFRIAAVPKRMGVGVYLKGGSHPSTGEVLTKDLVAERELPEGPMIHWEGPTPITADDICSAKPELGCQASRASEWLRALLSKGPVPATVVEAQAHVEGIGYTTVRYVKRKLGIESQRVVVDGQPRWDWVLPKKPGHSSPEPNVDLEQYFDKLADQVLS